MKYILFIILVVGIVGCASEKRDDRGERVVDGIQVMVVNDCQYVVYLTSTLTSMAGVAMVHAGNCNNHIQPLYYPFYIDPKTGRIYIKKDSINIYENDGTLTH